jgi:hypothetical protein
MQPVIRTPRFAAMTVLCALLHLPGQASPRPLSLLHGSLIHWVESVDSSIRVEAEAPVHETRRICSCQILDLQSNNYRHRNIAVFAEKNDNGDFSADVNMAKKAIEKEKKHLKLFFYDKMEVVGHWAEPTDCQTLFLKLKAIHQDLVMYDILDANLRK